MKLSIPIATIAVLLASCGHPVEPSDVKMAGVGNRPDQIGPEPEPAGGYVEYDLVDFAGAGLSLATLGLVSFDEVGPEFALFKPPYTMVYGLAFLFDEAIPGPDAHFSSIAIPPGAPDTCWTIYEPFSFLTTSTVDVGDGIRFESADGGVSFGMGRYPEIYPPDPQDVFVYYINIEGWTSQPETHMVPGGSSDPLDMQEEVLRPANFQPGSSVAFSFPGGISPLEAPVSSIPLTSAYAGTDDTLVLPQQPSGVMLSWSGPLRDAQGEALAVTGPQSACLRYYGGDVVPQDASDCEGLVEPPAPGQDFKPFEGQMYTGPWDADDDQVVFRWEPGADGDEVFLNVRFLGPIDPEDPSFVTGRVPVEATDDVAGQWQDLQASGEVEGDLPQGYRAPLACDDPSDVDYGLDPSLLQADGSYTPAARGDPTYNLVEVSCRLADDGEFALTRDRLADAIAYGARKGAQGALFAFGRARQSEIPVPPVLDKEGFKREISPVILRSHAVQLGRFWLSDPSDLEAR